MKDYFGRNAEALKSKRLYLFDMDGTVYLDETLFDGVAEMLERIEKKGGNYVFITNNSSRSVNDYVAKMHRLGLKKITAEHFFTSAQATLELLQEKHPNALVYIQATRSLVKEYREKGIRVTTEYDPDAEVVLVGFDPEFTGEKVYNTCKMLTKHDLPYYATNPDWVCPVEFGYIPDCGAMCHSIELATGKKPFFIGKPQPTMVYAAMKKFGCSSDQTVVVGDRLYTDIASGNNAGVDTVCVLSGEVKLSDVEAAEGAEIPTYLFGAVKDMPI
ncbi:MAG: HAD-IIA family hydrolase [Clostridia bacterium]|nr:HAD-IIA family hydrolase [Clostridia bacterium]